MSAADYTLLGAETLLIALVTYGVIGQAFKPAWRWWMQWRTDCKAWDEWKAAGSILGAEPPTDKLPELTALRESGIRVLTRILALVVGCLLGWLNPFWPSWIAPGAGWMLGVAGGSLCWWLHPAVKAVVPKLLGVLPEAFAAWLGGPAKAVALVTGGSVTQTIDTLDDTVDSYGDE